MIAHCTIGYYFDSDVENGGDGFLIGVHRCANFKVPLRDVRYSSKDPVTNRITFAGNAIKHPKGVPYLVDCNVTGSNPGTSSLLYFPLKLLWEHSLMPAIKKLVGQGGPCEGAQVVYQEDNAGNAGPHTEAAYTQWMQDEFNTLGWKLELQAPQGSPPLSCVVHYMTHLYTRHSNYHHISTTLHRSIYERTRSVFVSVHVPPAFSPTSIIQ